MRKLLAVALARAVGLVALVGCGQDTATASLRALDSVGDVSILCLGKDRNGAFTRGMPRSECPDFEYSLDSPYNRRFHALVTQPQNGEVALVDLAVAANNAVVDFEPTQPGYSFMPVGAEPSSIVSTPGGVASFVGVRESGREGIFALPSSCIAPRAPNEPIRDIRTWPACRLPAAPGLMVLLIDPPVDQDQNPATPGRVRPTCDADYADPADLIGQAPGASRGLCPADLATELSPPGRRKLAVALPSLSELWVLDAQELLDRPLGSFDACNVEERLPLRADVTDAAEILPPDLVPSSPSCAPVGFNHGPVPDTYVPWPVDAALDDQQRLFLADSDAPVIHVLDVSDPCALSALPPLEPRSYDDPGAIITTRRLAVSPLTPLGKRFVYAVDGSTTASSGTLMAFDVSPGSTNRTPIVRERSPWNPAEPPDRIVPGRDVADVEFVFQDFPEPANSLAVEGVACDPDPLLRPDSPAAEYRPSSDLTLGASPRKLRGTFAFAAMLSGQMAVIDVEDLDSSCRRRANVNPAGDEDLFGCKGDSESLEPDGYRALGVPTVSNELSCNIVAPHRARSRGFFTNASSSARSAALLGFPSLTLDTGRSVSTDQTPEGKDLPKLLGARHTAGQAEQLFVGPRVYDTDDPDNLLDLNPATADRSSLLLSYEEPRAYFPGEEVIATYEGVVRETGEALLSVDADTGLGVVNEGLNASYCSTGLQDMDQVKDDARRLGASAGTDLDYFARRHADYVQIVGDLLNERDPYWFGAGAQCGLELFQGEGTSASRLSGRPLCEQFFGPIEIQSVRRDFRIVEAREDYLLVEPRNFTPERDTPLRRRLLSNFAACCFPGPAEYQIRAGNQWVVRSSVNGFVHNVTTDPASLRCVSDCNPMYSRQRARAYEITCSENCPTDALGQPPAGYAVPGQDSVCVVDSTENGIDPGETGAECVFQNLTMRFAVYRGQLESVRDMTFHWQLSDGYTPLLIGLTNADRPRSIPQSILPLPEESELIIMDGSARGLTFVSSQSPGTIRSIF